MAVNAEMRRRPRILAAALVCEPWRLDLRWYWSRPVRPVEYLLVICGSLNPCRRTLGRYPTTWAQLREHLVVYAKPAWKLRDSHSLLRPDRSNYDFELAHATTDEVTVRAVEPDGTPALEVNETHLENAGVVFPIVQYLWKPKVLKPYRCNCHIIGQASKDLWSEQSDAPREWRALGTDPHEIAAQRLLREAQGIIWIRRRLCRPMTTWADAASHWLHYATEEHRVADPWLEPPPATTVWTPSGSPYSFKMLLRPDGTSMLRTRNGSGLRDFRYEWDRDGNDLGSG